MKIPKTIYHLKSNLMFVGGLVLFILFFAITYTPNYGLGDESLSLGDAGSYNRMIGQWYHHQGLCLPICMAIVLGVVSLSRIMLILTTRTARLREGDYFWWQLAEVAVTSLFINLFLSLLLHVGFFENLPLVLLVYTSVCIYPYAFYWLLSERIDRDVRLADAQRTIMHLRHADEEDHNGMIRFSDQTGNVRMVVSSDNIICIESAGNYVTLLYLHSGRLNRYSLRNTMKGIEPLCDGTSLARCHRSYYINLSHVRLLRKTADGLVAEMDTDGVDDVPVSKSFAAEVSERISRLK